MSEYTYRALAKYLDVDPDDVREMPYSHYGLAFFKVGRNEYAVAEGEKEREEAFEKAVESYIEDVIFPDLPEIGQRYFNIKSFVHDAELNGEQGGFLAPYDSEENEIKYRRKWYFIYRIN